MKWFRKLTRRTFLGNVVCLGAFLFSPGTWAWQEPRNAVEASHVAKKLVEIMSQPLSARAVGTAYLRSFPWEADVERLVKLILSSAPQLQAEITSVRSVQLRDLILQLHRRDFELGHTVNMSGWVLSQTEARLCALTALI